MDRLQLINFFKVLFGSVGGKLAGFIALPIVAGYLGPEKFGLLSVWSSLVALVFSLMSIRFSEFLMVDYFKTDLKGFKSSISSGFIISLGICGFLILLAAIFSDYIENWFGFDIWWVYAGIGAAFFNWFYQVFLALARLLNKMTLYSIIDFFNHALTGFLTLFFVVMIINDWFSRVYAIYVVGIILMGVYIFFLRKNLGLNDWFAEKKYREVISFCGPLILHSFVPFVRLGLDKVLLVGVVSAVDLGEYSLAITLGSSYSLITMSLMSVIQPSWYRNYEKNNIILISVKQYFVYTLGYLSIIFLGYFVLRVILIAFFSGEYESTIDYLPIISLNLLFFFIYRLLNIPLFYAQKTRSVGLGVGLILLVQIVFMISGVQYLSIMGMLYLLMFFEVIRISYLIFIVRLNEEIKVIW